MNLGDYKTEIGSLLHDASHDEFSATDITRWVNQAQLDIAIRTGCLQRIFTDSTVDEQVEYDFPSNALKILGVMYNWETKLYPTSRRDLDFYDEDWYVADAVTEPTHYRLVEKSRKIAIYPPASADADTTAINDASGISATDTTITVDSTSDFPDRGRILIDSEVIGYTHITSTSFKGCTRGLEDTTAATHNDNATVTLRDLAFWCIEKPADLSDDADIPWNSQSYLYPFHIVIIPYCMRMAKWRDEEFEQANIFWKQYLAEVEQMKQELRKLIPDRVYQYVEQEPRTFPAGFGYKLPIEVE